MKLSTGKFWELGRGWHPYGCCVSLPCHTSPGSRNRDLKRASRNTNINNIRKANWMCLDKWATNSDFSACFSKPKLLNKVFVQARKPVVEFKCLRVWEPEGAAQTSSASEVCSPSPYYIISFKSINDNACLPFFNLEFFLHQFLLHSSSFCTLLYLSVYEVWKRWHFEY